MFRKGAWSRSTRYSHSSSQHPDNTPLLWALRDTLGLVGTKYGCGQGTCGACTVMLDGRAVYACILYAKQAEGRSVRTIESVGTFDKPGDFQKALIDGGAVQCGYCIPGMIMTTKALLDKNPNPTTVEIKDALSGNLCRCTGYTKIINGVETSARRLAEGK